MGLRKTGICGDCGKPLYGDDYGAAGHSCRYAPVDELETLKAKVRRYFEMKALGHVNYFSKEDRKEFLELETDIQELVK